MKAHPVLLQQLKVATSSLIRSSDISDSFQNQTLTPAVLPSGERRRATNPQGAMGCSGCDARTGSGAADGGSRGASTPLAHLLASLLLFLLLALFRLLLLNFLFLILLCGCAPRHGGLAQHDPRGGSHSAAPASLRLPHASARGSL
eukprot:96732-Rhodomonas_salina.3